MKKLALKTSHTFGNEYPVYFQISEYSDDSSMFVGIVDEIYGYPEPWNDLTVNLGIKCKSGCAFIDTNNNGNDIIDWLTENQLGKATGRIGMSGRCAYPEFEFDMEKLKEYVMEGNL